MEVAQTVDTSSISGWYAKETVFITGGSGFLGKALIFKLLQVGCSRIYVLIRPKRGQNPQERLDTIMKHEIYDSIRKKDPEYRSKVFAVGGDVTEPNLGMTEENRQTLIQNVTLVFHGAASVKFDDPLTEAVYNNLKSTRDVVDFATEMKNLKMFNYISTGYSNCDKMMTPSGTEEKVYDRKMNWRKLIAFVESNPADVVNAATAKIVGASMNTYIFTKHLSEALIQDYSDRVPMVITRPPIVNPSLREPYPGWIDNMSSPVAIVAGTGKGVMRLYIGTEEADKSYTPVDFCINSIMVASWHEALNYQKNIYQPVPVYNQESCPLTTGQMKIFCFKIIETQPVKNPLWNTHFYTTNNTTLYDIGFFFLHFLPGLLVDTILRIAGQKPRLLRIYRKLHYALYALYPLLNLQDNFIIDNYNKLKTLVPKEEKDVFYLDVPQSQEHFLPYLNDCCIGFRKFVGEPPDLTEKDFIVQRRMKILDGVCGVIVVLLFLWYFPLRLFLVPFLYVYNSINDFIDSI